MTQPNYLRRQVKMRQDVDRETGMIKILDYLVTEDVGRKINPMIIEGQMAGGLAQGIGGALLEEFVYDETGQPQSTSFMDYLLPTAMEMPKAQFHSTEDFPTPHNPLGVTGAGEGGITAAGRGDSRTLYPTRWEWK